jgi:hypothetical protein
MAQEVTDQEPAELDAGAPNEPQCRHHWIIDPPAGPTSRGHCKNCGEERFFLNSTLEWVWDNGASKGVATGSHGRGQNQ